MAPKAVKKADAPTARTDTNSAPLFETVRRNARADVPNRRVNTKGRSPLKGGAPAVRPVRTASAGPSSADGDSVRANSLDAPNSSAADLDNPARLNVLATMTKAGGLMLQLQQAPGAVRAVLGSRADCDKNQLAAFASQAVGHLMQIALADPSGKRRSPGPVNVESLNAMLQAVAAFAPADELEGMLAIQAAAFHHITLDCLACGQRAPRTDVRAVNLGQANKCARTFAALVETLNRHRGKVTTQRVVVENVTVQAGGQAVVGAVAGVGASNKQRDQAHGQTHPHDGGGAPGAALPGPQSGRDALSATSEQGQEALPHARRRGRKRSAKGQSKQPQTRSLERQRNRDQATDKGNPAKRARTHRRVNEKGN